MSNSESSRLVSSKGCPVRDAEWYQKFRRRIVSWYRKHARDLPWRATIDPYKIWVSEIMLQQTQVATVLGYYSRFLEAFPTVRDLADADEQSVLKLWEGLGYYRRARQLHAAAKVVRDEHGGHFPTEFEAIRKLPGIGRYTAGAIASFAFNERAPILEANTIRLFSRLVALRSDPKTKSAQEDLWQFAEDILPNRSARRDARVFAELNQAVMELGSRVCKPDTPECSECPLESLCPTHSQGLQAEIPLRKQKAKPIELNHFLWIVRRRDEFLFRQNPEGEWWQGLWDFPRERTDLRLPAKSSRKLRLTKKQLAAAETAFEVLTGLRGEVTGVNSEFKHGVTKYRIRVLCLEATLSEAVDSDLLQLPKGWAWVSLEKAASTLPLTSTAQNLVKRLGDYSPRGELPLDFQ
ncbi:MAG: A/G-specific adenine glycosylase [Aureliella sp.]